MEIPENLRYRIGALIGPYEIVSQTKRDSDTHTFRAVPTNGPSAVYVDVTMYTGKPGVAVIKHTIAMELG